MITEQPKRFNYNGNAWYVMRVTYQRELFAKKILDEMGVTNYVPQYKKKIKNKEGVVIKLKDDALIHNYIFIFSSYKNIMELKQGRLEFLRFMMEKENGVFTTPQTVREDVMMNFIKIVDSQKGVVIDPDSVDLKKGERVRVLTGIFAGVEGTLVTMPNKRSKRVVVKIDGIAAVATITLTNRDVERIV